MQAPATSARASTAQAGAWWTRPWLVAALTILVCLLVAAVRAERRYADYLAGYWVGDETFLAQAGLRDLQLFVDRRQPDGGRRAYLVMTNEQGGFLANQGLTIRENAWPARAWAAARAMTAARHDSCRQRGVTLDYDEPDTAPTPWTVTLALSVLDGSLTIYEEGAGICIFAHKDPVASEAALDRAAPMPGAA